LTGSNTIALHPQQEYDGSQNNDAGVHQVDDNNNNYYYYNAGQGGQNEYKEHDQAYMAFVTEPNDKQSLYRRSLEVNVLMSAVPKLMYWVDQEVTWDMYDHPRVMPNLGGYALVMDPTFVGPENNINFSKVLIDNGRSINIMYRDTMDKLGISENMLQPSKTSFHDIVPGLSCSPMGKSGWMSCLATETTFGWRTSCSRTWTLRALIMPC
jgi:hypothetical protein